MSRVHHRQHEEIHAHLGGYNYYTLNHSVPNLNIIETFKKLNGFYVRK